MGLEGDLGLVDGELALEIYDFDKLSLTVTAGLGSITIEAAGEMVTSEAASEDVLSRGALPFKMSFRRSDSSSNST